MRYFIVRVLINAIAVAVTVTLLPGFTVTPLLQGDAGILSSYLFAGAVFGILNALIRPAILLITGHLFLTHIALFVVVVNSIMLYLVETFTPTWTVSHIAWIIPGGLLMGLGAFVLESLFGLDSPSFDVEQDPFYWRWLSRIPIAQRNRIVQNMRLQQLYDTIWHYGIDIAIDHTPFAGFRNLMQGLVYKRLSARRDFSDAAKVRLMLQELGPTYVKIGQMISSRADALPDEWRNELEKLQNNVPPFPYEEVQSIIQSDLHGGVEEIFSNFNRKPLAAASTAQVHEAALPDGQHVVVKVQRPDIVVKVQTDLDVMRGLAQVAEQRIAWARANDVSGILDEFGKNVIQELDYTNEAFNARRLAHNMAEIDGIRVPQVYGHYSTSRVMTMDFVRGVKITDVDPIDAAGLNRSELARTFLKGIVKQVIIDGFFHGDPHPGNVLVDTSTGEIIFLDTGLMGEISTQQRMDLADMIWSLRSLDAYGMTQVAIKLSTPVREIDEGALRREIDRMIQRYFVYNEGPIGLSKALRETLDIAFRHGLRMNNELTIAVKAMIQAEEIVRVLDPSMRMIDEAYGTVRQVVSDWVNPENVSAIVKEQTNRLSREIVQELPSLADASMKWIKQYQRGKLSMEVNVDTAKIDEQISHLSVRVDRLTMIILMAGLIVGSAIATSVEHPEQWQGLSVVAFFIFMGSSLLGAYLALRLFFQSWFGSD